jgi:hypothetical protein
MPAGETFTQLSSVYTPGDVSNQAWQNGSTNQPQTSQLGQTVTGQHTVPIAGVVAVAAVLALLELRRKRIVGRR